MAAQRFALRPLVVGVLLLASLVTTSPAVAPIFTVNDDVADDARNVAHCSL